MTAMTRREVLMTVLLFGLVPGLVGCPKKHLIKDDSIQPVPGVEESDEPSGRGKSYGAESALASVYFEFDSVALSDAAQERVAANAEWLKRHVRVEVRIGGHCDERGTTEFNLSLGQRRAAVVRDHLIHLGVPGGRITTISFGEEQPADPGHTEAAWSKSRRAEFLTREK